MKLEKGLIAVYTGDGKGKTTAALGQGIRSAGHGLKVIMVQFLKSQDTGELSFLHENTHFSVYRFERPRGFAWTLNSQEKKELQEDVDNAMAFIQRVLANNECDVLILDEVMGAISHQLIDLKEFIHLIQHRPVSMEIILTGRNVPPEIAEIADYVTEMKLHKHPFEKGIAARKGIES